MQRLDSQSDDRELVWSRAIDSDEESGDLFAPWHLTSGRSIGAPRHDLQSRQHSNRSRRSDHRHVWRHFGRDQRGVVPPKKLKAEYDGFDLHAATHFAAHEREAIEHFCRYAGRGPLATSRLSLAPNGNLIYRLKAPRANGTTHVVFTPHAFFTRPSWLIVMPGMHVTRYHGVLAPNHPWRSLVVL